MILVDVQMVATNKYGLKLYKYIINAYGLSAGDD